MIAKLVAGTHRVHIKTKLVPFVSKLHASNQGAFDFNK